MYGSKKRVKFERGESASAICWLPLWQMGQLTGRLMGPVVGVAV